MVWKMIRKYINPFGRLCCALALLQLLLWFVPPIQSPIHTIINVRNISLNTRTTFQQNYIINTSSCKIWEVEGANEKEIKQQQHRLAQNSKCKRGSEPLIVIQDQKLTLHFQNTKLFKNCCYREIERAKPESLNDTIFSDWLIKTSSACTPVPAKGVEISSSFIRVECDRLNVKQHSKTVSNANLIDFASIIHPPQNHSLQAQRKTLFWDKRKRQNKSIEFPPNILMIGIDGVSRLNMQRSLPQTRKYALQNDFIEFKGFTTTYGEDSFKNIFSMLLEKDKSQYKCWFDRSNPLDNCSFIWKNFSTNQYITAIVEDSAHLSVFSEDKRGFLNQPVDYTLRTLMVAAQTHLYETKQDENGSKMPCFNGKDNVETTLKYIQDFVKTVGQSYPYFLISLFRTLTKQNRGDFNALRRSDTKFLSLLKNILETNSDENNFHFKDDRNVNNTLIILYSTHGQAFEYSENSFDSSHDAALPTLLIRFPPNLKNNYPELYESMKINSERLTSGVDIYETLKVFQDFSRRKLTPQRPMLTNYQINYQHRLNIKQKVYSLVEEIPLNRTCEDASIPDNFCMCDVNNSTHGLHKSRTSFSKNWNTSGIGYELMMRRNLSNFRDWAVMKVWDLIKHELEEFNFPFESTLEDYVLEKGGEPIRTVIVTTWRSGSSFLGEIFENHPGTYYYYEPLFHLTKARLAGASVKKGVNAIKNFLNCDYSNTSAKYINGVRTPEVVFGRNTRLYSFCKIAPQVCKDEKFLERMCRLFPFQAVKTLRMFVGQARPLLEDPTLNVTIIHLVRDPRGMLHSCSKISSWCANDKDYGNPKKICSDLVRNYYEAEELRKEFPDRFFVVRYEDIVTDVYTAAKKILKFSHMGFHPNVKAFLDTHTNSVKGGDYSTYRDSKSTGFRWIGEMANNFKEIETIQESCKMAMDLWGYKIIQNSTELNGFNPVIKTTWSEMLLSSSSDISS